MNNYDLQQALGDFKHALFDCKVVICSMNELNISKIDGPVFYILNTDMSWGGGRHWICLYFPKRGPCEFFDSLGCMPNSYYSFLEKFILVNRENYLTMNRRLQRINSSACGYYVLVFIFGRLLSYTYRDIAKLIDSYNDSDESLISLFRSFTSV